MSLCFRLLLLLPFLHLFVATTPLKLKAQIGPAAAASQQLPSLEEESPDHFDIELHVPAVTTYVVVASTLRAIFDPPALQSVTLDDERPKPRA